jgi:hypothetical protein
VLHRLQLVIGFVLLLTASAPRIALGQPDSRSTPASITAEEIVQQLVARNQDRAQRLTYYTSERHYHVEYRGFPHAAEASMDVQATCDGPSDRNFRVLSESGSRTLIDHVLKKLLASEQEGAQNQQHTALTPANYLFTLTGTVTENGRQLYVLKVEPKVARKLLYRGTIWVDAEEYAVVRIEAEPAQSPSFWIKNTEIHHVYAKTGDFWLPESDRSETKARLGGTAILTINYGTYNFAAAANQAALLSENPSR